jgi:hypothetical protein
MALRSIFNCQLEDAKEALPDGRRFVLLAALARAEPRNDQAARFINEINYVRTASPLIMSTFFPFPFVPACDGASCAVALARRIDSPLIQSCNRARLLIQ